jgi:hypothetical protein
MGWGSGWVGGWVGAAGWVQCGRMDAAIAHCGEDRRALARGKEWLPKGGVAGNLAGASLNLQLPAILMVLLLLPPLVLPLALQGNRQAYYEASNSLLHEVLTKREGIPISLAVLHQAVSCSPKSLVFSPNKNLCLVFAACLLPVIRGPAALLRLLPWPPACACCAPWLPRSRYAAARPQMRRACLLPKPTSGPAHLPARRWGCERGCGPSR